MHIVHPYVSSNLDGSSVASGLASQEIPFCPLGQSQGEVTGR